jgi:hypothetical protein
VLSVWVDDKQVAATPACTCMPLLGVTAHLQVGSACLSKSQHGNMSQQDCVCVCVCDKDIVCVPYASVCTMFHLRLHVCVHLCRAGFVPLVSPTWECLR